MGFESFQVTLFNGKATAKKAIEFVRSQHCLIEIEITSDPVTISCRFTLCHPPKVDPLFIALIAYFAAYFQMEVKFADERVIYSRKSFGKLRIALESAIAERRREWRAAFGSQQFAAQTHEVHERLILAQCVTPIETAG